MIFASQLARARTVGSSSGGRGAETRLRSTPQSTAVAQPTLWVAAHSDWNRPGGTCAPPDTLHNDIPPHYASADEMHNHTRRQLGSLLRGIHFLHMWASRFAPWLQVLRESDIHIYAVSQGPSSAEYSPLFADQQRQRGQPGKGGDRLTSRQCIMRRCFVYMYTLNDRPLSRSITEHPSTVIRLKLIVEVASIILGNRSGWY